MVTSPANRVFQRCAEAPVLRRLGGRTPGARALEIGCGTAFGSKLILDQFGAATVDAVDLEPTMVTRRRRLGRERLENPRYVALRFALWLRLVLLYPRHRRRAREGRGRGRDRPVPSSSPHPVPHVGSLAALKAALAAADLRHEARRIGARLETVGADAARELPLLRPPPDDAARLSCRVDAKAKVCVGSPTTRSRPVMRAVSRSGSAPRR